MRDQRVWSVEECAEIFCRSVTELKQQLLNSTKDSTVTGDENNVAPAMLVWDKVRHVDENNVSPAMLVWDKVITM